MGHSPVIQHSRTPVINTTEQGVLTRSATGVTEVTRDLILEEVSVGPGTDTNFNLVTARNVAANSAFAWDNLTDYGRPISAVGSLSGMFTLDKPLYIPDYCYHYPGRQSIYMGYGSTGTPYSFVDRATNGLFASDTVWMKGTGWTITPPRANSNGTQTGDSDIYQTVASLVEGETYVVQYLFSRTAGSLTPLVGGTAGTTRTRQTGFELFASDTIVAGADGRLTFRASHDFVGSLGEVRLYKQGEGYREYEGNTFFGHNAAYGDTVGGGDNSFYGVNTAWELRNGGYNSVFGSDAGLHFRDTYYCSAFGKVSQYHNQDGYFDSSFGSHSLYNLNGDGLTTGIKNAAFGSYAGYNLITGSGNSIFGHAAMFTGTANIQGCAFGWNSQYNTLGNDNSTYGTASGYTIRNGNRNAILGSHVCSRSGLLDGNNNIVIGYDIDLLGDPSNTLSIGNLLFATGMTSNNTTISYGNVGIRTRAPRAALEVNAATSDPCMYLTYNDEDGGALVNTVAFTVSSAGDLTITPSGGDVTIAGAVSVSSTNGIDINQGSDVDGDLITVGVTGAPKLWWDESSDAFALTHQLAMGSNLTGLGIASDIGGTQQAATGGLYILALDDDSVSGEGVTIDSCKTTVGSGSGVVFRKARGTPAAPADVVDGDQIGYVDYRSFSGTKYWQQVSVSANVDGTFVSGQAPPSRLVLSTNSANGSSTERMRITSRGDVKIGVTSLLSNTNRLIVVQEESTADYAAAFKARTSGVGYCVQCLCGVTVNDYVFTGASLDGNTVTSSIRGNGDAHFATLYGTGIVCSGTSGALTHAVPAEITSYTLTWPAATANGYVKNTSGTLSYSGLSGAITDQVWHPAEPVKTLTAGAVTINWTVALRQQLTMNGDASISFTNPGGPTNCQLTLNYTGAHTPAFTGGGLAISWANGTEPTWTKANGKSDIVTLWFNGTKWRGSAILNFTT